MDYTRNISKSIKCSGNVRGGLLKHWNCMIVFFVFLSICVFIRLFGALSGLEAGWDINCMKLNQSLASNSDWALDLLLFQWYWQMSHCRFNLLWATVLENVLGKINTEKCNTVLHRSFNIHFADLTLPLTCLALLWSRTKQAKCNAQSSSWLKGCLRSPCQSRYICGESRLEGI